MNRIIIRDKVYNLKPLIWFEDNLMDSNISVSNLIEYNCDTFVPVGMYDLIFKDKRYALIKNKNKVYCVTPESIENFKLGDIVKITNTGRIYSYYKEYFTEENDISKDTCCHWQYGKSPKDSDVEDYYKIIHIGKHYCNGITLFVIQNILNKNVYLIGEEGVELSNEKIS